MQEYTLRRETVLASEATQEERRRFIRRTYAHLAAAIFAFMGITSLIVTSPLGLKLTQLAFGHGRGGWMIALILFIGVAWMAERWSRSTASAGMQYLGLAVYVVAEAFLFTPLLFLCTYVTRYEGLIPTAGLITGITFGGLTAIVFLTKAEFSWMRNLLAVGSAVAVGVLFASLIFGFQLGIVYCAAVVALAAGYMLYHTSKIIHSYPVDGHVGASLALFADIALMFWYVLQILMRRR